MSFNYYLEKRKRDKDKLQALFQENKGVEENKLIAVFSKNTGYRFDTIRRMLDELRDGGYI